jgi:hypothetical protein
MARRSKQKEVELLEQVKEAEREISATQSGFEHCTK